MLTTDKISFIFSTTDCGFQMFPRDNYCQFISYSELRMSYVEWLSEIDAPLYSFVYVSSMICVQLFPLFNVCRMLIIEQCIFLANFSVESNFRSRSSSEFVDIDHWLFRWRITRDMC